MSHNSHVIEVSWRLEVYDTGAIVNLDFDRDFTNMGTCNYNNEIISNNSLHCLGPLLGSPTEFSENDSEKSSYILRMQIYVF